MAGTAIIGIRYRTPAVTRRPRGEGENLFLLRVAISVTIVVVANAGARSAVGAAVVRPVTVGRHRAADRVSRAGGSIDGHVKARAVVIHVHVRLDHHDVVVPAVYKPLPVSQTLTMRLVAVKAARGLVNAHRLVAIGADRFEACARRHREPLVGAGEIVLHR